MEQQAQEVIRQTYLDLINQNDKILDYFIGGSRRFGFAGPNSDLDVFVLADSNKYFLFLSEMEQWGFNEIWNNSFENKHQYTAYVDSSNLVYAESIWCLGNKNKPLIHLVIWSGNKNSPRGRASTNEYFRLKEEHLEIEKILSSDTKLLNFCRMLKITLGLSGADFYRKVLKLLKNSYVKPA